MLVPFRAELIDLIGQDLVERFQLVYFPIQTHTVYPDHWGLTIPLLLHVVAPANVLRNVLRDWGGR